MDKRKYEFYKYIGSLNACWRSTWIWEWGYVVDNFLLVFIHIWRTIRGLSRFILNLVWLPFAAYRDRNINTQANLMSIGKWKENV